MDAVQETSDDKSKKSEETEQEEQTTTESEEATTSSEAKSDAVVQPFAVVDGNEELDIKTILQSLIDNGTLPADAATSILDSFTLTFYKDGTQPPEETTTPELGDTFNMKLFLSLPPELLAVMVGGEYYDFQLPNELKVTEPQVIELKDGETVYGTITINPDGTARIEFNENITSVVEVTDAGGEIYGVLDQGDMDNPGGNEIKIPGEDSVPGVPIEVKPKVDSSISKNGVFDRVKNPNNITWTIEANKDMESLTDVTLDDTLSANIILPATNIEVETFEVDFDGNPIPGTEKELMLGQDYTIESDGTDDGHLIIKLVSLNQPVRVIYDTEIDRSSITSSGGTLNFNNEVTLNSNEVSDLNASATLTGDYEKRLGKNSIGYDPSTQTVTWEIKYNFDEATLDNGYTLTDKIPQGMSVDWDSILVRSVSINDDGTLTYGDALKKGTDYTVLDNGDGTFTIASTDPLNTALSIQYTTKVTGILDDDSNFKNEVSDGDGNTAGGNHTVEQQNVIKRAIGYDLSNNTVTWQIEVNNLKETMTDWSLTDTFTNITGEMIPESLTMLDRDTGKNLTGNLYPDQSGDFVYENSYNNGFAIQLINNYKTTNHSFLITVTVKYDGTSDGTQIENTANVHWTDQDGKEHDSSDKAVVTPTDEEFNNGGKGGSYNATDKTITWSIVINYTSTGLENAFIFDPIYTPQNWVHGSLKIYHYTVESNGAVTKGDELSEEEMAEFIIIEPFLENGEVLYIEIPDGDENALYYFEYQTSLDGELIGSKTYENSALFHNDLTTDNTLSAEVSVAHGGEYVGKQGVKNGDGSVSWDITVNPSQSKLEDVVIKDIPSDSQLIDIDSVKVYPTVVDASGSITLDTNASPLVLDQDYRVDYYQNDDGNWEMDIYFINDYQQINEPYIINYGVTVLTDQQPGTNVTLTNNVKILYNSVEEGDQNTDSDITVSVGGGSGWIVATQGSISFEKVDALTDEKLEGAVFELYYLHNNTRQLIGTRVTTDENGLIEFNRLPRGDYELVEVSAPEGYSLLSPNPYEFTLDENNTGTTIEIANEPSAVTIYKQDSTNNQPLTNAVFTLYKETTAGNYEEVDDYTTDTTGAITINKLEEGNYYFLETTAPAGYKPDTTTKYEFTITRDSSTGALVTSEISNTSDGVIYNEPIVVHFYKYDESGLHGLPNAEFTLEKYNDITQDWDAIRENETIKSDANGEVEIVGLAIGRYRISETKAPLGYAKEPGYEEFVINDTNARQEMIPIDNLVNYPSQFELTKMDSENNQVLAGAEFELWWENPTTNEMELVPEHEDEVFTTDSNGKLALGGLELGVQYYLIEVKAPSGYSVNPEPISIVSNSEDIADMIHYDFYNDPGIVVLQKESEDGDVLSDATFDLEKYDETNNSWTLVDTKETDDNGVITIERLAEGDYRFIEKEAPNGYLLDSTPITFSIEADENGKIEQVSLTAVDKMNEVNLMKQNSDGKALANAKFILEAQLDDGTWIKAYDGQQFVSDEDGTIQLTGVPAGDYRFIEVEAPKGYQLSDTPIEFSITRTDKENVIIDPVINYKKSETPPPSDGGTDTGDTTNISLFIGLAVLSVITVIGLRRRSAREDH
ncbi:SpaA isopeptide-forming pilin-related protein [Breznakia pachnodae]|uniref:Surface anchored protein n=1 Tax=Breznakia pachnodae TaxID=265178 RepID=A0ABU0E4K0_9FIRM|nr:SpaA isopeptide-forming pilin-related protein [Breznakia pachnodae]MDQ0361740.1 putative surface anchored protein [Breznakia pachnodae]